jgi:TolB-like protein/DNA-binding winged helix-turn-helix (wHTH) protein/Tfp pilus assembly protein PilF
MSVFFGDFALDQERRQLLRLGEPVPLEAKAYELLGLLVTRRPRVLSKTQIRDVLWPGTTVGETSLPRLVTELRQALGDDVRSPRFIRTAHGFGYAFCGEAHEEGQRPSGGSALVPGTRLGPYEVRRRALSGAALLVLLAAGLFLADVGGVRRRLLTGRPTRIQSLAVLPFANLSADSEQEYFADGMTEQISTSLARLSELRVISRTSAMSYTKTEKRLPQIARELNVDWVVEGSVARVGERVRVTAKLMQATTEKNLWAESYERDVSDILALQGEIAGSIARKVEIELTPDDRTRLDAQRRIDPQAYEAYVKGSYFWNKQSEPNLKKAADEFQRALDFDPTYAAAWAGLADAYSALGYSTYVSPLDVAPKARAAAAKALELDPGLAAPHASLGYIHMYFDWDFAASESEFRRAIALDAGYVTAHDWYSLLLMALLRPSEARREIERARALDPLSGVVAMRLGGQLFYDGRYEESIKALRDAIAIDPKNGVAHYWVGRVFQAQGKYAEAIAEYRVGEPAVSQFPVMFASVGHLDGVLGKRKEALAVLADLDRRSKERYVSPYCWALVYLGLGENDKALAYLNRSLEERTTWLVWLLNDTRWNPMRSDPRFQQILRRMGFPADVLARAQRPAA